MSTRIPQSFLDELITRTDIVELINSYVPLKKKGKEYMACCPFHNEKTPSFTVSPDKQFYYCFGCEAHGTALGFLMEYERLEFLEAVEALAQHAGMEVPRDQLTPAQQSYQKFFSLLEQAQAHFREMLCTHSTASAYLKNRGLSDEVIARFGLGYAPDRFDGLLNHLRHAATEAQLLKCGLIKKNARGNLYDLFRNRIMFPIKDRRGRVIAFGGRVIDDAMPKYLNSPDSPVFHKSEVLYGMHEARKAKATQHSVLVVEGYMDVLALAQHGIENTVATLGTSTTTPHIQQLYRHTQEIIFCFDGDAAGQKAAWRAAEHTIPGFKDGLEAKFLFLPQGEDPDSLIRSRGKTVFQQYMKESLPLSTFIFERLSQEIDLSTPAGKARLAQMARPLLEKFPDGVFKKLIFEELENKVGVAVQRSPARPVAHTKNFRLTDALTRSTPVRLAISALLHEPSLAAEVSSLDLLQKSLIPGVPLLTRVITIWKEEPDLGHAALIERFRGQQEADQLQKLLTWNSPRLQNPKQAFEDAMNWICRKTQSTRIQGLIEKEKEDGLSEQEKQELRDLLHRKMA